VTSSQRRSRAARSGAAPALRVSYQGAEGATVSVELDRDFHIGRDDACAIRFAREDISRTHTEVAWRDGDWWINDLQSTNGTFVDGDRIESHRLATRATVQLGSDGPRVDVELVEAVAEQATPPAEDPTEVTAVAVAKTTSYYVEHYLEGGKDTQAGPHTMMIRQAFATTVRRKRRAYLAVIAVVVLSAAALGAYAIRQHAELARQRQVAEEIFYSMKGLELELATIKEGIGDDAAAGQALADARSRFAVLQKSYDKFLAELEIYGQDVPEEKRIILHLVRVFGECEVAMPAELVTQVERSIEAWRDNHRLAKAVTRAEENGYGEIVTRAMLKQSLPPQLFYVALQESDLRVEACGPKTRWGIAKGPWQFVPSTAIAYGLKVGPLYLLREPDPRDERQDFVKATAAAARYLRDLYDRDAQGSALLAVASYNWGESNIRGLIRTMPENPRERNFWRLLLDRRREIPRETFSYVFRVLAAAVVGENPELFGFEFDNPLSEETPPSGNPSGTPRGGS